MPKNYYKILGVQCNSNEIEIKNAYRDLAKVCHPDVGGNEDMFKELNEAYSVLSDYKKRSEYDKRFIKKTVEKKKKKDRKTLRKYDAAYENIEEFKIQQIDYKNGKTIIYNKNDIVTEVKVCLGDSISGCVREIDTEHIVFKVHIPKYVTNRMAIVYTNASTVNNESVNLIVIIRLVMPSNMSFSKRGGKNHILYMASESNIISKNGKCYIKFFNETYLFSPVIRKGQMYKLSGKGYVDFWTNERTDLYIKII